ncbi:hypothetical protein LXL04_030985 [Taraxacum kok-saghyz]
MALIPPIYFDSTTSKPSKSINEGKLHRMSKLLASTISEDLHAHSFTSEMMFNYISVGFFCTSFPFMTSTNVLESLAAGGTLFGAGIWTFLGMALDTIRGCLAQFADNFLPLQETSLRPLSTSTEFTTSLNRIKSKNIPATFLLPAIFFVFPFVKIELLESEFVPESSVFLYEDFPYDSKMQPVSFVEYEMGVYRDSFSNALILLELLASKSPVKVTVATGEDDTVARRKNQFAGEDDTVAPETRRRRRHCSDTVATL